MIESISNVVIGYGVALLSQIIIFPIYGIDINLKTNIVIGFWFTLISIIRSFTIRRLFNRLSEIKIGKEVIINE
ncbi:MAG: hypothetical protein BWY21_01084 [Parcubacteria group bacterium ADurb.Bin216]|nr:MAG: hypothetical protein BWY21_01084 [Parcubacteria group bacterium ADurb.Bin216]